MTALTRSSILVRVTTIESWWPQEIGADDGQQRLEASVRRLLRCANDSFALAAEPLAQTLCEVTGIADPRDALKNVIARAFRDVWPDSHLRDLFLSRDGELRRIGSSLQAAQVSTRHFQRRRAKAVSILAVHVRRLLGAMPAPVDADDKDPPRDCVEAIAKLVADFEPSVAAELFRLGGPQYSQKANTLDFRGSIEVGAEIGEETLRLQPQAFAPLFAVLEAQSNELNGRPRDAEQKLRPLFTRSARDAAYGSDVCFELEWLNLLRARHRGHAGQIERVANNLVRISQGHSIAVSRALLAQADARIRRGRLYDATVLLDQAERLAFRKLALRQLSSCSLLRAEIALQQGDYAVADRLASGAYIILHGRHYDAYRSQAAIARASLSLAKSWSHDEPVGALSPTAWDRISLNVETARHRNAAGLKIASRELADASYATAMELDYDGLAARAAATIGRTHPASSPQRREWYLRALALQLRTQDRSTACDLFIPDDSSELMPFEERDEAVPRLLFEALKQNIPQLGHIPPIDTVAALDFLDRVCVCVFALPAQAAEELESIVAVARRTGSFAQYATYFMEEAKETLAAGFFAIVGSRRRAEADRRLTGIFGRFADAIDAQNEARRFLVG